MAPAVGLEGEGAIDAAKSDGDADDDDGIDDVEVGAPRLAACMASRWAATKASVRNAGSV
jgi:hypothetical protein